MVSVKSSCEKSPAAEAAPGLWRAPSGPYPPCTWGV